MSEEELAEYRKQISIELGGIYKEMYAKCLVDATTWMLFLNAADRLKLPEDTLWQASE